MRDNGSPSISELGGLFRRRRLSHNYPPVYMTIAHDNTGTTQLEDVGSYLFVVLLACGIVSLGAAVATVMPPFGSLGASYAWPIVIQFGAAGAVLIAASARTRRFRTVIRIDGNGNWTVLRRTWTGEKQSSGRLDANTLRIRPAELSGSRVFGPWKGFALVFEQPSDEPIGVAIDRSQERIHQYALKLPYQIRSMIVEDGPLFLGRL